MTTIKDKLYFNYDGVESKSFKLTSVGLGSGLYEEDFIAPRTIEETKPSGRDTSIFHGVSEEDRVFDLNLAFDDGFTEAKLNSISEWIFKDYYRPLYFEGRNDRVMFAMMTGDSKIVHNGLEQGYFTVSVKTNSPYIYSDIKTKKFNRSKSVSIVNNGHKVTYPMFKIKKIGDGDLTIDVSGYKVRIINLKNGETLSIDTMREKITTDLIGQYRYDNVTIGEIGDLALEKGTQTYKVTGEAEIECNYREIFRF